ncbi:hypothetical protein BpHYR1_022142 [Brachionus plicatilis]|uniref:Uncharacterized protein n=1 Tax=Brachionus plicatilis TaxID=10195 RepID=A0A3M7P7C0_BRAPC|nr:hypothetical protein BpHYR1_022142 [Brachionus plicatilis]
MVFRIEEYFIPFILVYHLNNRYLQGTYIYNIKQSLKALTSGAQICISIFVFDITTVSEKKVDVGNILKRIKLEFLDLNQKHNYHSVFVAHDTSLVLNLKKIQYYFYYRFFNKDGPNLNESLVAYLTGTLTSRVAVRLSMPCSIFCGLAPAGSLICLFSS